MQSCLEKKGIEARNETLVRNDYGKIDEYSALHTDAIGNGDPLGKGTMIGGHTHTTPFLPSISYNPPPFIVSKFE